MKDVFLFLFVKHVLKHGKRSHLRGGKSGETFLVEHGRKKQYIPFVISKGKGVNRNPIVFSITLEGKEFLTLTQQIKEAYNEQCKFGENKKSEIYK